ncbi:MAG: hypothetical protein KBT27_05170 [Prevotellaceae bacterium]|nr:hypothetical protein [Candidatus Faecinaster equi]
MTYYEFIYRWTRYYSEDDFYTYCCTGGTSSDLSYIYCRDCMFSPFGTTDDCILDDLHSKGVRFVSFNNVVELAQRLRKAEILK